MLSGICPRGNSSAPGSGNTGIVSGRSIGPRYWAFIGMRESFRRQDEGANLRKQNRRQLLAAFDRRRIGEAPGLEELDELLARAVLVPLAIAADNLEQLLRRFLALA